MTRLIFITNLFLLIGINTTLVAQAVSPDSLVAYEYLYFKEPLQEKKETILLNKINYCIKHTYTGKELFNDIKRINYKLVPDTVKPKFLWDAALISYINNETSYAQLYLEQYQDNSHDSSVYFNLLSLLVNKYNDTARAGKNLDFLKSKDQLFSGLDCFYTSNNYERKHRNFYLLSSAIVPGSGTMMNGYPVKGLVSLAIAAGSVYGIVKLVQYSLYINAVLWGTGVGLKFYAGNIRLTDQSFNKAESRQKNKLTNECELTLKKILTKYPLTLQEK